MARPIEPTPPLSGEDAQRLERDLDNVCAPSEAQRRVDWAHDELREMMRPKGA